MSGEHSSHFLLHFSIVVHNFDMVLVNLSIYLLVFFFTRMDKMLGQNRAQLNLFPC